MFDINKLAIKDSADWHVTDAKGKPQFNGETPITITIHSPGTKKAAQAQFAKQSKSTDRLTAAIGGKTEARTEEQDRQERADFLAEVTASLNGFNFPGGAVELYKHPKLRFIADGVEKFYNDMGNFAPDSASNVSNTSGTQPG